MKVLLVDDEVEFVSTLAERHSFRGIDADWDDDGLVNTNENTAVALPATTDESWTQAQVFAYHAAGQSRDDSPDTDRDGLPDGLELGVRWPVSGTDTIADANGDGWKNFRPDLEPPCYNTVDNYGDMPDVDAAGTGAYRAKRVQGSATDPGNADTDYDGIPDGVACFLKYHKPSLPGSRLAFQAAELIHIDAAPVAEDFYHQRKANGHFSCSDGHHEEYDQLPFQSAVHACESNKGQVAGIKHQFQRHKNN